MGCWNGTCGISRLPIRAGEPVYGIVIRPPAWAMLWMPRETDISGYCYAHGMYYPLTLFFKGVYDDYGGIEDLEESPLLQIHNDIVTEGMVVDVPGDGMAKYDGKPNPESSFLEKINLMERERFFVKDSYAPLNDDGKVAETIEMNVPVGLWMVHADLIRHMEDGYTAATLKDRLLLDKLLDGETTCALDRYWALDMDHRDLLSIPDRHSYNISPYGQAFLNAIASKNADEARAISEEVIKYMTILSMMSRLRVGFHPQSGKGSQASSYSSHKALAKAMFMVCAKNKEYDYY